MALIPPKLTAPGVYVQEVPTGVHTIGGVPTSVAAFVGRAHRGPVNEPVQVNGFGDFQNLFGGLLWDCPATYAIYDFFNNGGSDAYIVRLWRNPGKKGGPAQPGAGIAVFGKAKVPVKPGSPVQFQAASPGEWGNNLQISVTPHSPKGQVPPNLTALGLTAADLFQLNITETQHGTVVKRETFHNCTASNKGGDHRVDHVLRLQSLLARVLGDPTADDYTSLKLTAPSASKAEQATGGLASAPLQVEDYTGNSQNTGMYALEHADIFNMMLVPPDQFDSDTDSIVLLQALQYCQKRMAMLLVDSPVDWMKEIRSMGLVPPAFQGQFDEWGLNIFPAGEYGAVYFPWIKRRDPMMPKVTRTYPPTGFVAGVYANTDTTFGVVQAPAGITATLVGAEELYVNVNDAVQGDLNNTYGVNVLRTFPVYGHVVWGARTLRGADQLSSDYKYVPVRRMALFIEQSLQRGLKFAVFRPNDEVTWKEVSRAAIQFMDAQFRKNFFAGTTPTEAYFVRVDKSTTTQYDIDRGIMNVIVGFAPAKPAEFVVLYIEQMVGQALG